MHFTSLFILSTYFSSISRVYHHSSNQFGHETQITISLGAVFHFISIVFVLSFVTSILQSWTYSINGGYTSLLIRFYKHKYLDLILACLLLILLL